MIPPYVIFAFIVFLAIMFLFLYAIIKFDLGSIDSEEPSTYDGLMSGYRAEVAHEQAMADTLNRLEVLRYESEKRAEKRETEFLWDYRKRLIAGGMNEHDATFAWLEAGGFACSKVRPPQVITVC